MAENITALFLVAIGFAWEVLSNRTFWLVIVGLIGFNAINNLLSRVGAIHKLQYQQWDELMRISHRLEQIERQVELARIDIEEMKDKT